MARRKELADVAHALSGIVISRNFDIAGAWGVGVLCDRMTSTGTAAVAIDAVSGRMSPHSWDIAALADEAHRELQRQLRKRGMPTDWVVESSIEITFEPRESPIAAPGPPKRRWWNRGQFGGEFVGREQPTGPTWFCDVTTRITNDHGRTYTATHRGWCWPVKRPAFAPAQLPVRFRSNGVDDVPTNEIAAVLDHLTISPLSILVDVESRRNERVRSMSTDWTEENIASCISVIDGVSPSDAIEAIIPGEPQRFASREEAEAWAYDYEAEPDATRIWVAAGEIEGHTFVWEDNGFGGSDPGTAERLSAGGRFVSVYWNVNALMSFTFAEHGRIEANFDALFAPEEHDWKSLEDVGASRISDDDWEEAPEVSALLVQSQVLGLSSPASPAWLDADGVEFWGSSY